MNQESARQLRVNELVALRSDLNNSGIDHIAKVANMTTKRITIEWARRHPKKQTINISDVAMLSTIRRCSPPEKELYDLYTNHEDAQTEFDTSPGSPETKRKKRCGKTKPKNSKRTTT